MLKSLPLVGGQLNATYKISDAGVNDNDVGKAVIMSTTTDTVTLAGDGDEIYGFIQSIEPGTEGGDVVVTVCIKGRVRVTLDGAIALGSMIESGAQEAAGAVKAASWANVSIHTLATDTVANLVASTFFKNWILISSDGTNGTVESL